MACDNADTPHKPEALDEGTTACGECDLRIAHPLSKSEQCLAPIARRILTIFTFGVRAEKSSTHRIPTASTYE